jgi:DNA-binding transcriptional ArsR family regulator
MSEIPKQTMRQFTHAAKALADETRVRVLLALRQKELCACQISELFRFAPSTMSQHMFLLRQAGLVESRKEGRWVYYSLPGKGAPPSIRDTLRWVRKAVADDPRAMQDVDQLKRILKLDPAELCKKQRRE